MSKAHNEGRWNLERDSIFLFPFFSNHLFSQPFLLTLDLSLYLILLLCLCLILCILSVPHSSVDLFPSLSVCLFSFNTCLYPSLYATPCLHHSLSFSRLLQYLVSHTLSGYIVDYLIILSSSDPV